MRLARQLNLVGWVKNEGDGTVRMEVQGESESLVEFLERLPGAIHGSISTFEKSNGAVDHQCIDFSIRS